MVGTALRRAQGALLALLTGGALLLAACGGSAPAPTAAPKTEAKPTEAAKPTVPASAPAAASPAAAIASPASAPASASPAAASAAASPAASSPSASPAASPSPAAAASPTVNGEVDSVDGRNLSVTTATGLRKVRVADNATILIEGKGSNEDLKPGVLVAITGKPDGTAIVVRLFPPGIVPKPSQFPMGGPQAGNIMTNANVVSFDGKALVVDLGGDKQTINVTPESQIVKPVPSTFGEVKPGVRVVALGTPDGDMLAATTVTILTQPNVVRAS
ncbi:MAG: hypothetical protein U0893_07440 [Chloroflexota bacterium]